MGKGLVSAMGRAAVLLMIVVGGGDIEKAQRRLTRSKRKKVFKVCVMCLDKEKRRYCDGEWQMHS